MYVSCNYVTSTAIHYEQFHGVLASKDFVNSYELDGQHYLVT